MNFQLAIWASSYEEREARRDVRQQARAWAEAEPNIAAYRIGRPRRPYPDRALWWEVPVTVEFRSAPVQEGLWAA